MAVEMEWTRRCFLAASRRYFLRSWRQEIRGQWFGSQRINNGIATNLAHCTPLLRRGVFLGRAIWVQHHCRQCFVKRRKVGVILEDCLLNWWQHGENAPVVVAYVFVWPVPKTDRQAMRRWKLKQVPTPTNTPRSHVTITAKPVSSARQTTPWSKLHILPLPADGRNFEAVHHLQTQRPVRRSGAATTQPRTPRSTN